MSHIIETEFNILILTSFQAQRKDSKEPYYGTEVLMALCGIFVAAVTLFVIAMYIHLYVVKK